MHRPAIFAVALSHSSAARRAGNCVAEICLTRFLRWYSAVFIRPRLVIGRVYTLFTNQSLINGSIAAVMEHICR